jgi:polysaccharide export outer membrane protein
MKSRGAHLFPFVLLGLLLTIARTTHAQQPPGNDSRNKLAEIMCRTPVTITGAVIAPSRVELRRRVRLNELLVMAGGVTERAGKTVEVTRAGLDSNCEKLAPVELKEETKNVEVYDLALALNGIGHSNPDVQPGDLVTVAEVGVIYIVGNVATPQRIFFKESITFMQAIAMAGDVLRDSMSDRVYIYRSSLDGSEKTIITVNLKTTKNRRTEDVVLQPYDIIEVLSKRGHPGPLIYKVTPQPTVKEEFLLRIIY